MNVSMEKYAPPIAVISIAVYLGWPPAAPMDLGEDVVRAKAVRWNVADLKSPELPGKIDADPFAAVLVESAVSPQESAEGTASASPVEPAGPTERELRAGLKLGGIAQTDRHRWAIVNNRVCKPGDRIRVIGVAEVAALIEEVNADHIKVVVGSETLTIRPETKRSSRKDPAAESPGFDPEAIEAEPDDQPDVEDQGADDSSNAPTAKLDSGVLKNIQGLNAQLLRDTI